MKTAAKILYLISQTLCILASIGLIFFAILTVALDLGNQESLIEGVVIVVAAAFCIANSVMCKLGWDKVTFINSILNIVFGALTLGLILYIVVKYNLDIFAYLSICCVNLVGGVLALLATILFGGKDKKPAEEESK